MPKPMVHAEFSAKKFGGRPDDYIEIHEKMDSTKIAHADVTHRCVFHSAFGIYLMEDLFGREITNSHGQKISVRNIAEQHVLEDLGFIPSLSDWLQDMNLEPWMAGELIAFKEGRKRTLSPRTSQLARIEPANEKSNMK